MLLGEKLYEVRNAAKKTIRHLAEELGWAPQYLSDVEHCRRLLTPDQVALLSKVFKTDLSKYPMTRLPTAKEKALLEKLGTGCTCPNCLILKSA